MAALAAKLKTKLDTMGRPTLPSGVAAILLWENLDVSRLKPLLTFLPICDILYLSQGERDKQKIG